MYIHIWSSLLYIYLHVGTHLLADTRVKDEGILSIQIVVLISVRIFKCLFGRNLYFHFFEVSVMAIWYRRPQRKFFDPKNCFVYH